MRIRGAGSRDSGIIDKLYTKYGFELNPSQVENIVVVEDDQGAVFAVGTLVKILEGAFLVDESRPRRQRVEALKLLLNQADIETASLGYDCYHSFATKLSILEILKRRFSFKSCIGSPLIKWVK